MTRNYFEHNAARGCPGAVAFDVVEFDVEPAPAVEVIEHEVPPPELVPLIAWYVELRDLLAFRAGLNAANAKTPEVI